VSIRAIAFRPRQNSPHHKRMRSTHSMTNIMISTALALSRAINPPRGARNHGNISLRGTNRVSDYAFIIGLEHYIADGLPTVQYAENDANAMAEALKELGFIVDTVLLSKDATKTAIEHKLRELFDILSDKDRFLLYYAGHGWAIPGHTILTCADTSKRDFDGTGIRLSWIMERLDESECTRAMFFLDACHSDAANLKSERGVVDHMDEKEIRAFFEAAEHKVCFAACKFSQKSISTGTLKHGVWTHQVLTALRGEDRKALTRSKYLTAHSLQDFLSATVPIMVKAVRSDEPKQTPVMYGSLTNDFEIADLDPLISGKQAVAPVNPAFKSAVYSFSESTQVRSLGGFKKGRHTVPREVSEYVSDWIGSVANGDVKERVNERFQEIKLALGLKRKDIEVVHDRIITKDFEYSIWCDQDSEEPDVAVFHEELSAVSPNMLVNPGLNELFDGTFSEMVVSPKKKIDVDALIDTIEELEDPGVTVHYDAEDEGCIVTVHATKTELFVTETSVRVVLGTRTNPLGLIASFTESRDKMIALAGPSVRLLN
jgi:Caspase domain